MNHIHMETRIEAPIEHVWAYLCDPSHLDDWSMGTFTDFSGPLDKVGTTFVQTNRMMGHEMKQTVTVVEVEPTRFFHIRSEGPMDAFYRMEPEGDATHLTVETDYEMPGKIPGFLKNLMSKSFVERQMRHQMENLKAFAEATVPVPA
jgi:uncharacterized protein YndB with AHSA1/START domain